MIKRIAMWSGPRNISTAMMRSWQARGDTHVIDEPFYAHYLSKTGLDHPGAEEVLEVHESNWQRVVDSLQSNPPPPLSIYYQKHMAHHLLANIDRAWICQMTNCFLIRHPREMVPSLAHHLEYPQISDTGLPQQLELFESLVLQGFSPPVLDARDVLIDPEGMLRALCQNVGVPFSPKMLAWPAGARATDGIWAKHWYDQVERSTGFRAWNPSPQPIPDAAQELYDACLEPYARLYAHRLSPEAPSAI